MNRSIGLILIGAGALLGGLGFGLWYGATMTEPQVSNFAECAARGYPVQESFPERCVTPDGASFTNRVSRPSGADEALRQAREFQPDGICAQVMTSAVHMVTGAAYTFPTSCLLTGWQATD